MSISAAKTRLPNKPKIRHNKKIQTVNEPTKLHNPIKILRNESHPVKLPPTKTPPQRIPYAVPAP